MHGKSTIADRKMFVIRAVKKFIRIRFVSRMVPPGETAGAGAGRESTDAKAQSATSSDGAAAPHLLLLLKSCRVVLYKGLCNDSTVST